MRKFKQWYDFMSTAFGVSVLDAYCANKNNLPIQDVSDFGGCTGQDLFNQGIDCEGCSRKKSDRECDETTTTVQCLTEDKPVCYSNLTFTTSGLELNKGCESFRTCVEKARAVSSQCFGSANEVHCKYCCIGDSCNHGNTLGRTRIITFDLSTLLRGTLESNLFNVGSLAYTQFQTGIANILTNQALGTYHVIVKVIAPSSGEFTVIATIDCNTLVEKTELTIYNFIYTELKKVQGLYEHDVKSWSLDHPSKYWFKKIRTSQLSKLDHYPNSKWMNKDDSDNQGEK
ncbi:hypothetical protein KP79_PYT06668 [Mizuhopecten yessoensis]|uniref:Uncharacterized protein n=1 Tax=Mizuhopecten yessoensis TaxID=6573 RepID=A0A210QTC3_MIZYE|nr:hypothetical protein KP79_PYT06668 [Mizuhopecten yessoensis]